MAKYLNLSGLQTLWAKLKDTFALKKHSHTVEDIPVDSALSSTSTNPVQNKVVNTALDTKQDFGKKIVGFYNWYAFKIATVALGASRRYISIAIQCSFADQHSSTYVVNIATPPDNSSRNPVWNSSCIDCTKIAGSDYYPRGNHWFNKILVAKTDVAGTYDVYVQCKNQNDTWIEFNAKPIGVNEGVTVLSTPISQSAMPAENLIVASADVRKNATVVHDTAVGSSKKPIYATSQGKLTECDGTLDVSISGNAATASAAKSGSALETAISGKANAASVTGATKCKVTYNSQGVITAGADLAASDIPNLATSKITSGTFADERIASASKWNAKQDALTFDTTPTESSSNPVTSAGVKSYVDAAVTGLYKYRGSVNTAYINALQNPSNGDVYNINASGTITNGEGGQPMSVLAGDNVAFVLDQITSTTYWDKMSSELDLSNFVDFDDIATATTAGVVKSSSTNGKVSVDASGVMTVNGWSGKQNALTQGTNITISGNTISATDTTYSEPTDTVLQDIVDALT